MNCFVIQCRIEISIKKEKHYSDLIKHLFFFVITQKSKRNHNMNQNFSPGVVMAKMAFICWAHADTMLTSNIHFVGTTPEIDGN